MTPGIAAGAVERVHLRRTSRTAGVADVRLPAVHIRGIWVNEQADGSLTMRTPEHLFIQPVWREAVLREISLLWAAS